MINWRKASGAVRAARAGREVRPAGVRWRAARRGGLATLVTLGLLTSPVAAAWAGQEGGGGGNGGYSVSVHVSYRGNATQGASPYVSVKAACRWTPAAADYQDAVKMLAWYKEITHGEQLPGMIARYGPLGMWKAAVALAKAGTPMSWYMAYCVDPSDYSKLHLGSVANPDPVNGPTLQYIDYRAFPTAQGVPAPLVNPADLAEAARDQMYIAQPLTNRNPRIAVPGAVNAADAPTLVDLPTWFWVQDAGAVGTRTIRAQIVGSNIWAQVVAKTGGLLINSPVGDADCTPAQARTAYGKGVKAANACTVSFTQASVHDQAGWPVVVSTDWSATWTGSGGTGGTLDGLHREADINVPVAEVQNVVTR